MRKWDVLPPWESYINEVDYYYLPYVTKTSLKYIRGQFFIYIMYNHTNQPEITLFPVHHTAHTYFFVCKSRCLTVGTFNFYWRWMKKNNNVRYTLVYILRMTICNLMDIYAGASKVYRNENRSIAMQFDTVNPQKKICFDAGLSFDPKVLHHGSNLNMTWRIYFAQLDPLVQGGREAAKHEYIYVCLHVCAFLIRFLMVH